MKLPRHFTACSALLALAAGYAAAESPPAAAPPLPADVIEAVKKGVLANEQHDYPLAIRFYQEARAKAPPTPEIYVDLGVAEGNIPGRELRAICWLQAYLGSSPNARNLKAVQTQISTLEVKNQSNISHLLKLMEDEARQMPANQINNSLSQVAELWADSGDIAAAQKILTPIQAPYLADRILREIAIAQVDTADFAAAQKTADQMRDTGSKIGVLRVIAAAQADVPDAAASDSTFTAAEAALALIADARDKTTARDGIIHDEIDAGFISRAETLAKPGTMFAGYLDQVKYANAQSNSFRILAQKLAADRKAALGALDTARTTANKIPIKSTRSALLLLIAADQAQMNEIPAANQTLADAQEAALKIGRPADRTAAQDSINQAVDKIRAALPPDTANTLIHPAIAVWLTKLDDDNSSAIIAADGRGNDCALNTEPFLDLTRHLAAIPVSDSPQKLFDAQRYTATTLIRAQNVVNRMLQNPAKP